MSNNRVTNALALDCEMVEAFSKYKNSYVNMVARVSLVNEYGNCVYDTYVRPTKPVTDYRTMYSGVTENHLARGEQFHIVKADVAELIRGRILVGHDVGKDLKVLGLCHPDWNIRDTTEYPPYQSRKGNPHNLKYLANRYLGWIIQNGAHSSVEDARATMMLYKDEEEEWEEWLESSSEEEEGEEEEEDDEEEEGEYYYDSSSSDD